MKIFLTDRHYTLIWALVRFQNALA